MSLKNFVFSRDISDAASHAIQHILESTTSIQRFEFREASFTGEQLFCPIAQAIINSECMSELKFWLCKFEDRESFAQLQGILQNKQNLTTLCFEYCNFGEGQVHGDIISIVSQPDSRLRCFEFQSGVIVEEVFARSQFNNLLRAIEKSKLERFQIGTITTPHYLQALTESIPSMKLKELEVGLYPEGEFDQTTIRQDLLYAVKNNFSLRSVKAELFRSDLFNNNDKQRLAFYANRNESLDQWVHHPEKVEQQKVWPDALNLAQRAGPNALFHGMRSVLERDYGSSPGKRKRKRPQYYTPT